MVFKFNILISHFKNFVLLLIVSVCLLIFSCAVQEPPSGGEDDTTPPRIVEIYPADNTVNFSDNKIRITFDEYVDRRSFREALFITPKPKGEIKLNWSGKEVEIEFSKPLEKNKTYVFTIGKLLKDVNRGNPITEPITFAISTGSAIDSCKIFGKVFDLSFIPPTSEIYRNLVVTAYRINNQDINPEVNEPDFVCPVAPDGKFVFNNLPFGKYRLFAIVDNDRNYLFNKDFDNIAVTNDLILNQDIPVVKNVNFFLDLDPKFTTENCLKLFDTQTSGFKGSKANVKWFMNQLFFDSTGFVAFSYKEESDDVSVNPSIVTFLKNQKISKLDLITSTELINTSNESKSLLSFFWISDSIVNISTTEKLDFSTKYILKLRINNTLHNLKFKTAPVRKFGSLTGNIYGNFENKVIIFLINNDNGLIYYNNVFDINSKYEFKNVLEGNYILVAYIDMNEDGLYNRGNYFPHLAGEPFFIYPELIKINGNWTLENVNINF